MEQESFSSFDFFSLKHHVYILQKEYKIEAKTKF